MNSLPTIQDTPQSTNSAIGTRIKSAGWLFTIVAFCAIVLLVAFNMVQSSSFQPSLEQQLTLLHG